MTRGQVTRAQAARLLQPVREDRIDRKQGMAYVPQHEVRAELIRTFGPGHVEHTMTEPVRLYEERLEKGDPRWPKERGGQPKNPASGAYWITAYMVGCNLRVFSYTGELIYDCTEYHVEENAPLPNRGEAHAMAVTSAQSYALRRAALSLGDAMGLHLYDGGKSAPLVINTLLLAQDPDSPLSAPQTGQKLGEVPEGQDEGNARPAGTQPASEGKSALARGFAHGGEG